MYKILAFAFVILGNFSFACNNSIPDSMIIEKIVFQSADTNKIQGTLYLPSHGVKSIVIKLVSIDKSFRHPDFTLNRDTLVYRDIYKLTQSSTGVLLVAPRLNYWAPTKEYNEKSCYLQTPETLAEDVLYAFKYLKADKRFVDVPVGVMGGSAAGVSAAMAASRSKEIDFAILLVTPSTKSVDEADYMWKREGAGSFIYKGFFEDLFVFFNDSSFVYNGKTYRNSNEGQLMKQFHSCAWDCTMKIYREVLLKNENNDTIQLQARKMFKESFKGNKLENVRSMKFWGKEEKITASQFIDRLFYLFYSPANISYLKWDPENYYPGINCPVLMLFGDKDINIDFEGSLANSNEIVKRYNKTNFTIEVINGVDHNFSDKKIIVKEKDGKASKPISVGHELYYPKLISWLNKIHE